MIKYTTGEFSCGVLFLVEERGIMNPNEESRNITTISKNYFLVFLSLFSAFVTISMGIMEIIDNKIGFFDFIRIIIFILATIVVVVYSFSDSSIVYCFKSFIIFAVIITDVLTIGYDTIRFALKTLDNDYIKIAEFYNVDEKLIISYAIILLIWFAFMYIFLSLDIMRSALSIRAFKMLTIFCGYIAFLAVCGQIMLKMIIEGKCTLILNFFPYNSIYALFLLTNLLAIGSKRKMIKSAKTYQIN